MGASAAIMVGGQLLGGHMQSQAAGRSSDAMRNASREQLALQREMWQQGREDITPWREAGAGALGDLQAMLSGEYDITTDPGYQFQLEQGQRAIDASAAARGNLMSGRTLRELTGFGQGLASQEYANRFNRLASLAGVGQASASQSASLGQNFANQGGEAIYNAGQARASGYLGQANAWSNAINQGTQLYGYGRSQGWWGN